MLHFNRKNNYTVSIFMRLKKRISERAHTPGLRSPLTYSLLVEFHWSFLVQNFGWRRERGCQNCIKHRMKWEQSLSQTDGLVFEKSLTNCTPTKNKVLTSIQNYRENEEQQLHGILLVPPGFPRDTKRREGTAGKITLFFNQISLLPDSILKDFFFWLKFSM